ncbi:MAG: flagellar biosynthesis anti-sigma factor FlgM [Deltaproteobacteria bacterium]|nr:flagellar biosynthesis anti-sigma factor FlgM [Deltaproteobacteria bacterium]
MKVSNTRPALDAVRIGATTGATVVGAAPADRATGPHLIIEAGRQMLPEKRAAALAKLQAQVQRGDYAPDAALVAEELLADREAHAQVRSMMRH